MKKKPEIEEAIGSLDDHLAQMKEKIKMYKMEKGIWDPDKEFEINESDDLKR